MEWETGHGRLERRRIKRLAVAPERIGLCGALQIIAVRRERTFINGEKEDTDETSYYISSCDITEHSDEHMLAIIRDHWACIENGIHYRRDVSFGEDACRVAKRNCAHALASLRNLAIGTYELAKDRGRTDSQGCKSWSRRMTFTKARKLLTR